MTTSYSKDPIDRPQAVNLDFTDWPIKLSFMFPSFQEKKATQAAGFFLKLRGGSMSHMKLIKLLYLMDREALLRWGAPVTYDRFASLKHGPVLSAVLSRLKAPNDPDDCSYWHKYISEIADHEVRLVGECPLAELSPAETELAREIFSQFGHRNRWKLVEHTHGLPEWTDPAGSSLPISYGDILRTGDYSESDVAFIEEEMRGRALGDQLFGR